jgi:hypothetical protein
MSRRVVATSNGTVYIIALVVIVVAFLLLGGWQWMLNLSHGNGSLGMHNWNWATILISGGIGFVLGLLVSRRSL